MAVHNPPPQKLVDYLRQLGLATDETQAYLCLLNEGPQTVLALSRTLQTGRTKLYPLLEQLIQKQLATKAERHYGTTYQATPPETLGFLVDQHEQHSTSLRSGLPATLHTLNELQRLSPATSKIVEYHDLNGLKQLFWNISDAKTDYYMLQLPAISKQIGSHLHDKLQAVLTQKQITGYVLTNQKKPTTPARFINPNIFTIESETYVYNTVVSVLSYENDTYYGVEIHNQQVARQYRQLLAILYKQSTL